MTSGNFSTVPTFKNLIPRTQFPQVSGNIVIPLNAPNSNIVRFTAMLRNITATSALSGTLLKFYNGAALNFNVSAIRNEFIPASTLGALLSVSANNLSTIIVAGTDEAANVYTNIEVIIYNWNQASKKYGSLRWNLPTGTSSNGKQYYGDWQETTANPFDGFYLTWGAKTPDANSYYQIDQLG